MYNNEKLSSTADEMHQVVGESFRSTFEKNWRAICAKLTGEEMEMGLSFEKELKVLNTFY